MEEERNWRQCMLASAARTFAKHRQSLAKDAAIDSLAVEVCSIADALRTAEDIASASDLHKPKLDSIVDELTAILAGTNLLPSSNVGESLWAKDPKLLATMVAEDTLADIENDANLNYRKVISEHDIGIEEDTEAIPVEEEGEEKEHPLPADTSLIAEGVDTPSSPSIALVCCGKLTGIVVYSDTTLLDGLNEVEADLNTASKTDALNPSETSIQEVGDVVLQEFLEREFRYAQEAGLEAMGDIARAGLTMSPVHLREFLDLWVQNQFSTSALRPRTTRGQREPAAMNYGMRRKKPSYSSRKDYLRYSTRGTRSNSSPESVEHLFGVYWRHLQ
nr:unnamed protein product [Callosobruchus analis]